MSQTGSQESGNVNQQAYKKTSSLPELLFLVENKLILLQRASQG